MSLKELIKQAADVKDYSFRKEEFTPALCGYITSGHRRVNKLPAYSYKLYSKYISTQESLSTEQKMKQINEFFKRQPGDLSVEVFPLLVEKDVEAVLRVQSKHPELKLMEEMDDAIIGVGYLEMTPYAVVYDIEKVRNKLRENGEDASYIARFPYPIDAFGAHYPWFLNSITDIPNE